MSVGRKLMLIVTAMLLAVLGIAISSWYSLASVSRELDLSTGLTARKLAIAGNIKAGANGMRTGQRGILLNSLQHDRQGVQATMQDYSKRHQTVDDLIAELKPLLVLDSGRALTSELETQVAQHASSFERITELCEAGRFEEAAALYKQKGAPAGAKMEKTASELMQMETDLMAQSAAAGKTKAAAARWTAVAATLLALLLLAVVYRVQRDITLRLKTIAAELGQGAEQMEGATSQLSSASQSLAQGASEQAASIEETSASSQEITAMARHSAERANTAAGLMTTVDARAGEANRALDQMLSSMQGITSSSDRISKIIKVIDEISFQTNILALNAAVEAARAGEAGMGFAVVADEVRNLAQRSAQAAKDTAALIEDSISKSKDGGGKLEHVAEVIGSVIQSLGQVKALVDELHSGSEHQDTAVNEIAKAISMMERVTQNNASSAEQTASASEEMQAQATALRNVVAQLEVMAGVRK